ncbi:MAG: hypothetical protein O7D33_09165, partial [Chloroflexi bacterium]|nr:hypothetical protein [Chloroflexota bacterium]
TATSVPVTFAAAFGPIDGVIVHNPGDGFIPTYDSGVNVADMVIEARFFNAEETWSRGFIFRNSAFDTFHTVFIRSDRDWYHILSTGSAETRQQLRQEASANIDTSQGGNNHLRLISLGEKGWLFINGIFVAQLDLSGLSSSGDVEVIGSYFVGDEVSGGSVRFEGFSVRPIQREFGPGNETIFDEPGFISTFDSGVTPADAIVEARFFNPYPTSAGSWSSGFLLRHSASNRFHAVFIRSDREWYHYVRTGTAASDTLVQQTSSTAINTSTGGSNLVRVVVVGNEGWLFINGTFAGALDLSALTLRGNTAAMTGYFSSDEIAGESTFVEDFTIWSWDTSAVAPVATPTPTATPVPKVTFVGTRFSSGATSGSRITVDQGATVQVFISLEVNTPTDGQLELSIVKDISFAADEIKRLCAANVSLSSGIREIFVCDFVADEVTGGSLRHYFIRVQWNGEFIHDPTDPNTREYVEAQATP